MIDRNYDSEGTPVDDPTPSPGGLEPLSKHRPMSPGERDLLREWCVGGTQRDGYTLRALEDLERLKRNEGRLRADVAVWQKNSNGWEGAAQSAQARLLTAESSIATLQAAYVSHRDQMLDLRTELTQTRANRDNHADRAQKFWEDLTRERARAEETVGKLERLQNVLRDWLFDDSPIRDTDPLLRALDRSLVTTPPTPPAVATEECGEFHDSGATCSKRKGHGGQHSSMASCVWWEQDKPAPSDPAPDEDHDEEYDNRHPCADCGKQIDEAKRRCRQCGLARQQHPTTLEARPDDDFGKRLDSHFAYFESDVRDLAARLTSLEALDILNSFNQASERITSLETTLHHLELGTRDLVIREYAAGVGRVEGRVGALEVKTHHLQTCLAMPIGQPPPPPLQPAPAPSEVEPR